MAYVKPKKRLGQHFLKDNDIAHKIVSALFIDGTPQHVLEIGPGTGVLSDILLDEHQIEHLLLMDLDEESIAFLNKKYKSRDVIVQHGDFLKVNLNDSFGDNKFDIIGNFPYNISSQIFFKVLDHKDQINSVVCMLQKEVAERIVAKEGNKTYGILSIFLQSFFDIEYLFTVPPHVFDPPPKVNSGVIRLTRNNVESLGCDEVVFRRVVKAAFHTRRKTLRNALKVLNIPDSLIADKVLDLRAEQLSVADFVQLTKHFE